MKQLTCEMCGSTDLIKQDGVFVCQSCGCKYSVDEAKRMIKDISKEVKSATKAVSEVADAFKDLTDNLVEANNEIFKFSPQKGIDEAQYYVLEHLRDADYVADDIFDNLQFHESRNAYALIAVFGGPITYHWTASSGYDREETYTEYVEKSETINGQTRYYKEPVTKTRIVTDWRPASGTVSKYYFTHFVVDTNHFSKEDRDFRSHIGSNAVRKKENALSLWQVYKDQENGKQLYVDFKNSIPKIKDTAIYLAESSHGLYNIPGDHVKDIRDTADFKLESFKMFLYPIVTGQYKYNEQDYNFAFDALDGDSTNVAVDFPVQTDDKEKHDLILEDAKKQKQLKIEKKANARKIVVGIGWLIVLVPMIPLLLKWWNYGEPSIIFSLLLLLAGVIWQRSFNFKFKKDVENINFEYNRKFEQIKQYIKSEKTYKKYLRQEGFRKFIDNSDNEKFISMAAGFTPEKITDDEKNDEILLDIKKHEKQESLKQQKNAQNNQTNKSKSSKNKLGIICLSVTAVIIALIVGISGFNNRVDSDLVGTWRAERDSSISITFKNNGDMIARSSSAVDDKLSYKIDNNTVTVTFADNSKETYGYTVEGDTLIFGEYYYTRVK